jgi:DNA-binding transcriptional ArsR family regulator
MSAQMMAAAWQVTAPPVEKLLLLKLADGANDDGLAAPVSVRMLAQWTGVSDRTIQRALRALEQRGWVSLEARGNGPFAYRVRLSVNEGGDNLPSQSLYVPTAQRLTAMAWTRARSMRHSRCRVPPSYTPLYKYKQICTVRVQRVLAQEGVRGVLGGMGKPVAPGRLGGQHSPSASRGSGRRIRAKSPNKPPGVSGSD